MLYQLLAQAAPIDPTSTRIASYLLGTLLNTLSGYIENTSQTVSTVVTETALLLLTVYVILWGLGIATGHVQEAFSDGAKRIFRIALIINFALLANVYNEQLVEFVVQVPIDTANQILSNNSITSAVNTDICEITTAFDSDAANSSSFKDYKMQYFANILDCAMGQGIKMGNAIWNHAAKNSDSGVLSSLGHNGLEMMVYGSTAGIVATATGIIMVTFIVMALLLGLGPIFILLATFDYTRKYFEGWLGQLVTQMILFILVASIISICFQYFYIEFLAKLPLSDSKQLINNSVKILGTSIATFFVLQQAHSIAGALGHGVALHTQNGVNRIFEGSTGAGYSGAGALRAISSAGNRGFQDISAMSGSSGMSFGQGVLQRARMNFKSGASSNV